MLLKPKSLSLYTSKRENQFGPLQIVTFHQLTTVDKKFYLEQRLQPNQQKYQGRLIQSSFFLRFASPASPNIPSTAPNNAIDVDCSSPVFGSLADSAFLSETDTFCT